MSDKFKAEDFEIVGIRRQDSEKLAETPISFWKEVRLRFFKNKLAVFGGVMLFLIILFAIFGPMMRPFSYSDMLGNFNAKPNGTNWLGTDELGRDVFTRLWYGARVSLFIGVVAAAVDVVIGVIYGSVAGFKGGRVDNVMMRIVDILSAVPYLLIVILLLVVMKQGMLPMIVALTITGWINMARIVRGEILTIKNNEFVMASRVMGASSLHIIFKHLIPNIMGSIIVTMMLTIPSAIFTESFLGYLGLGIQLPFPSWGTMASEGRTALSIYPWRLFAPALAISLTIFAFNAVGDGLRDALDPKQRK
ncbi:MAG: ABC transporter permease [Eubacteriales bacterium]|nr:ABC transporter permease [Eubacteriales bacterium]